MTAIKLEPSTSTMNNIYINLSSEDDKFNPMLTSAISILRVCICLHASQK